MDPGRSPRTVTYVRVRLTAPLVATPAVLVVAALCHRSAQGLLAVVVALFAAVTIDLMARRTLPGARVFAAATALTAAGFAVWLLEGPTLAATAPKPSIVLFTCALVAVAAGMARLSAPRRWSVPIVIDAVIGSLFYLLLVYHFLDASGAQIHAVALVGAYVAANVSIIGLQMKTQSYTTHRDVSALLVSSAAAIFVIGSLLGMFRFTAGGATLWMSVVTMLAAGLMMWFASATATPGRCALSGEQGAADLRLWRLILVSVLTVFGPATVVVVWHETHDPGYSLEDIRNVGGLALLMGALLITRIVMLVLSLKRSAHLNDVAARAARDLLVSAHPDEVLDALRDEWAQASASPSGAAALSGVVSLSEMVEDLRDRLNLDPLTGLLSQPGLAAAFEPDGAQTVVLVDLDHYRVVSDRQGLVGAEAMLKVAADRLERAASALGGPPLGRAMSERFIVLLSADADAARAAELLHAALAEHAALPDGDVSLRATVALVPSAGTLLETLRRAETAAAVARADQIPTVAYAPGMDADRQASHELRTKIQRPGFLDEVTIQMQPIVRANRETFALEALARWTCDGERIPPVVFVPLVEDVGLIADFERRIVALSLAELSSLPGEDLPVTVNISPQHLAQPGFADWLAGTVAAHGLTPDRLIVEIVESDNPAEMEPSLLRLRGQGFRVYIDDFGTGHSNILRVKGLPVTGVKVAREVFIALKDSPGAFAQLLAFLAAVLPCEPIIEGVEDAVDARRAGPGTLLQGYHYSRPMDPSAVPDWLAAFPPTRQPACA